jgi:uncharacterized protein
MDSPQEPTGYRELIEAFIRENAKPPDKFSHQPRLYALAARLAEGRDYDDEVVYAAAWMHDLGVFVGHRPEDPAELARWDNVAYAMKETPAILQRFEFPAGKIPAVLEVIRTHQPSAKPTCFEGMLLRDADILEQLGAVTILRTVSKVGRDTRFVRFSDALKVLRKNAEELPGKLQLEAARRLAEPRLKALQSFLQAADTETGTIEW